MLSVIRNAFEHLNLGQIPVTTFDQPFYAIAKRTQWQWPETHGESKHVVMLGGPHIEMALWNTMGDILQGSGWVNVLVEAEILSSGTADSLLRVTHLTKIRHFHQVTLLALFKLQKIAYAGMNISSDISFEAWREEMKKRSTTFFF